MFHNCIKTLTYKTQTHLYLLCVVCVSLLTGFNLSCVAMDLLLCFIADWDQLWCMQISSCAIIHTYRYIFKPLLTRLWCNHSLSLAHWHACMDTNSLWLAMQNLSSTLHTCNFTTTIWHSVWSLLSLLSSRCSCCRPLILVHTCVTLLCSMHYHASSRDCSFVSPWYNARVQVVTLWKLALHL